MLSEHSPCGRFLDRVIHLRGGRIGGSVAYGPVDASPSVVSPFPLFFPDAIDGQLERLRALRHVDLVRLGERLGWVLCPGEIRDLVLADLRDAEVTGRRLRLRVWDAESDVGPLPWEYTWLPPVGFLTLHPNCAISRVARGSSALVDSSARHPWDVGAFRAVLLYANPQIPHLLPLGAEPEVQALQSVLQKRPGGCEITLLLPAGQARPPATMVATRANLRRALESGPTHLFVVIAHGDLSEQTGEGFVFLEPDGEAGYDCVSADDLAAITRTLHGSPAVVLLDTCWGSARGRFAGAQSVAQALAATSPAVVGMQFPWPAAACLPFSLSFFNALTVPMPIDDALCAARESLQRTHPGTQDWGCPVLHRSLAPVVDRYVRTDQEPAAELVVAHDLRVLIDTLHTMAPDMPEMLQLEDLSSALADLAPRITTAIARCAASSLSSLILERDGLYVMLAGPDEPDESTVETSPVWCSELLDAPASLTWTTRGLPGPWKVRLETEAGDTREWAASPGMARVPPGIVPIATWVRWEVFRGEGNRHVRGLFRVLEPEEAEQRLKAIGDPRLLARQDTAKCLQMAQQWMQDGHYEAARQALVERLQLVGEGVDAFALHRGLAALYGAQQTELCGARRLGDPEGFWAAALARWHVEAGLHALGLARG